MDFSQEILETLREIRDRLPPLHGAQVEWKSPINTPIDLILTATPEQLRQESARKRLERIARKKVRSQAGGKANERPASSKAKR